MKTPHEHIAVRAYFLWEKAGRPDGASLHFWLLAEAEENQQNHKVS